MATYTQKILPLGCKPNSKSTEGKYSNRTKKEECGYVDYLKLSPNPLYVN